MSKANGFTKGEWTSNNKTASVLSDKSDGLYINGSYGSDAMRYYGGNLIAESVTDENAHLIATAGTTATKLAEMGYDAVKVLQDLPELMKNISNSGISGKDVNDIKELLAIKELIEGLEVDNK